MRAPKRFMIAVTLATALGAMAASAEARDLSFSTYLPPNHPTSKGIEKFIEYVAKGTNGAYVFKLFSGGSLTSATTTLEGIRDGVIDAGVVLTVYTPSATPANALITDLATEENDIRVLSAAVIDTILHDCPQCLKEFERNDLHFLASYSTPPYRLMCRQELGDDINVKGLRVRVPGAELGKRMSELGAVPVNIPNSEAYEAMERNALDCVLGPISWMQTFSLGEVVKSVVDYPLGGYQGGTIINVSTPIWDDLTKEQRAVFEAGAARAVAETVYVYMKDEDKVSKQALSNGVKLIAPGKVFRDKQAKYISDQMARLDKERAGKVKDPQAIITAFHKNVAKWKSAISKNENMSQDDYEALLKTQLFSDK